MIRDRHGTWRTTTSAECEHWLTRPDARVRPPTAPVPGHLVGHPSGEVFARLVRMNDGPRHAGTKPAMVDAFDALTPVDVARAATAATAQLVRQAAGDDAEILETWIDGFAPLALGALCGIDLAAHGTQLVASARALAVAFGPAGAAEHAADADRAVAVLADLLDHSSPVRPLRLSSVTSGGGVDDRADEIGWFFQCFDACAALIGSTLAVSIPIENARRPGSLDEDEVGRAVERVLAESPPIHTTRRSPVTPLDHGTPAPGVGDMVLVSLDPVDGPGHPFGWGAHRCPAEHLVTALARHAVVGALMHCTRPHRLRLVGWRSSPTARIPSFAVLPCSDENGILGVGRPTMPDGRSARHRGALA